MLLSYVGSICLWQPITTGWQHLEDWPVCALVFTDRLATCGIRPELKIPSTRVCWQTAWSTVLWVCWISCSPVRLAWGALISWHFFNNMPGICLSIRVLDELTPNGITIWYYLKWNECIILSKENANNEFLVLNWIFLHNHVRVMTVTAQSVGIDLKVSLKPIVGKNDKCFRRDILQVFDIVIVVTC